MIFKFVVISSEEEAFLREFELDENNTLLDFHNILQEELEYDRSQMASFLPLPRNGRRKKNLLFLKWVPTRPLWMKS